jgi:RHS repeat-associated protein
MELYEYSPEHGATIFSQTGYEYQYHLKDHLGNVRMTFTTKDEVDSATATMETANAASEEGEFKYYSEAVIVNSEIFDHTNAGTTYYSTRLNGSEKERYGLAKSLSVMPGDTINASVWVKYVDPDTTLYPDLSTFLSSIHGASPPAGVLKDGGLVGSIGGLSLPFWALFTEEPENDNPAPKAYLNWLVFDRDYNLKDGGAIQLTTEAAEHGEDGAHENLLKQIAIGEAGYVYVYLSNDNKVINNQEVEVYFDDFKVEHIKSSVISLQDYYPFGSAFGNYQRESSVGNQYQYNGKELQDELSLGWLDYGERMYQSELGRWTSIDPMAEKYYPVNPYAYVANIPTNLMDPNGAEIWISFTYQDEAGKDVTTKLQYKNRELYTSSGDKYDGSDAVDPLFQLVKGQLNGIQDATKDKEGGEEIAQMFSDLESSKDEHEIHGFFGAANPKAEKMKDMNVNGNRKRNGFPWSHSTDTYFNPLLWDDADKKETDGVNPMIQLLHEMRHGHDNQMGKPHTGRYIRNEVTGRNEWVDDYEIRGVNTENILRNALGIPRRTSYAGKPVGEYLTH